MDPLANIEEQLTIARRIEGDHYSGYVDLRDEAREADMYRLAELVIALHEWRIAGGYDPYHPTRTYRMEGV